MRTYQLNIVHQLCREFFLENASIYTPSLEKQETVYLTQLKGGESQAVR